MASSTGIHCPYVAFIHRGAVSWKLISLLKKQGLSIGVAARAINKSHLFVGHLDSRHDSVHKPPHVIGEELTTPQISEDVLPFPESLQEDNGNTLVDVIENFPHLPDAETEVVPLSATKQRRRRDSKKLKAVSRVSEAGPSGSLPPHVLYLLEIGFDLEQIKAMARNDPYFAYYSLEGKIRPLVEFLLDLGVSESNLLNIMVRTPQLSGLSLSNNLIPKMAFLETLGVDKTKWARVISRFPPFLTLSRQKVEATVEFLYETGLSKEMIGNVLTRFPAIIGLSIEDQLRPKAEYFQSFGVDVAVLLSRCPQTMGQSMQAKLKPVTEFFLENGFSIEEIGNMISRFSRLYALSLKSNLEPKWKFFLTTDYSRSDLLKHPQYFAYSLEERIKPRYKMMKESGVKLSLGRLLLQSNDDLKVLLLKKKKKIEM